LAAIACGTSSLAQFWEDVVKTGCEDTGKISKVYRKYFDPEVQVLGLGDPIVGRDALVAAFVESGAIGGLCSLTALYWVPESVSIDTETDTFRWVGTEVEDGSEYVFDCGGKNKISEIVVT